MTKAGNKEFLDTMVKASFHRSEAERYENLLIEMAEEEITDPRGTPIQQQETHGGSNYTPPRRGHRGAPSKSVENAIRSAGVNGTTYKKIAEATGVNRANCYTIVSRLAKAGIVKYTGRGRVAWK